MHSLSHKTIPTIFMNARLAPVSQIFRDREIHKNLTKNLRQPRAGRRSRALWWR